ncbi:MAG: hypothetical protein QXW87_01010 [Desulfurococcaceae archaeon]|uniref:Uncharacterized protein n=1 Tax=Staphylothermus marinus TaxID=2280 RepID=A0A7C4H5K1_STAMA
MSKEVNIVIRGKPSYEKWSIYQWILETIHILEREYCIKINVSTIDSLESNPVIIINNYVIDEIPFDEGYVIECLKKILDKLFQLCIE